MRLTVTPARPAGVDLTVRFFPEDAAPADVPAPAGADASREPVLLYDGGARLALVAVQDERDRGEALRMAAAAAAAVASRVKAARVALLADEALSDDRQRGAAALAEGFRLGAYRFSGYRREDDHVPVEEVTLVTEAPAGEAEAAWIAAEAACLARDLVNRSPHEKTAPRLAEAARQVAEEAGLRCEVWDRDRIAAERMGGLLAVNRGSVEPPRFVVLEHRPDGASGAPVVLVGKAVVFDTGGLSLKPTKDSMDQMKADMAGGAAVIAAMQAVARLALPLHVIALIPMTDNRPGGDAYVPGDVVTMRNGLGVEVLNTDAEGRMLLADALDYARELEPALVIDLATLTGAQVIALGSRVAAALTPDDDGAGARLAPLLEAAAATGEWVHPLPMHAHFAEALESDVADLKNVGGREAGTITAAKFLEHFTQDASGVAAYPWIHLDIAGPAFLSAPAPYRPKGGTGFGVRLLVELLRRMERGDA